jgi:hypothetical protein
MHLGQLPARLGLQYALQPLTQANCDVPLPISPLPQAGAGSNVARQVVPVHEVCRLLLSQSDLWPLLLHDSCSWLP